MDAIVVPHPNGIQADLLDQLVDLITRLSIGAGIEHIYNLIVNHRICKDFPAERIESSVDFACGADSFKALKLLITGPPKLLVASMSSFPFKCSAFACAISGRAFHGTENKIACPSVWRFQHP